MLHHQPYPGTYYTSSPRPSQDHAICFYKEASPNAYLLVLVLLVFSNPLSLRGHKTWKME